MRQIGEKVENPTVEYVVHHQDSKQVHQWGNFTTINYDETVTYKNLPEAQGATEKDFANTSGDDAIIRKQIWLTHQEDARASGGGGFGNYISGGKKAAVNAISNKVVKAETKAIVQIKPAPKSLGNPYKSITLKEVEAAMEKQVEKGKLIPKPSAPGNKAYQNAKSKYSYNLDPGSIGKKGKKEKPHVDVNYPNPKPKNVPPKKKLETKN